MSYNWEKLMDKEVIDKFLKEENEKQQRQEQYIAKNKDDIMEKCYLYLKENKMIDNEDLSYHPEEFSFTGEDFYLLFNLIMDFADNQNKVKEEDIPFENQYACVKYKDINITLRLAFGQGTSMQMRTDLPELWNEKISFSYDEMATTDKIEYHIYGRCELPGSPKSCFLDIDVVGDNLILKKWENYGQRFILHSEKEVTKFFMELLQHKSQVVYKNAKFVEFNVNKRQGCMNIAGDTLIIRCDSIV